MHISVFLNSANYRDVNFTIKIADMLSALSVKQSFN
jgi:hypothetical protein